MPNHSIRLIGPWDLERETGAKPADFPTEPSIKVPCPWGAIIGAGSQIVHLSRRFHCPTNLDPTEKVFVVVGQLPGQGTLMLNGELLGPVKPGQAEFDVTGKLSRFNVLRISLHGDFPEPPPVTGEFTGAALEIRSEIY